MLKQYPHYLFLETTIGDGVQDANGNWVTGDVIWQFVSICREEPDGRGTEVEVGGTLHKVTATIHMPKGISVPIGAKVVITNDEVGTDVRRTGVVLNCDPSQLHTRIWL